MSRALKFVIWPLSVALLMGLYFLDNIRGYYRFKEICEKDAGLHIYRPLERNVGWTVSGGKIYGTGFVVQFNEVAFVRYRNEKDGNLYDVFRAPKLKVGDPGYAQQPADVSKAAVYKFDVQTIDLPNEVRLGAQHFDVTDLRSGKAAARYSRFSYGKFNPDNTILGAPSGESCPEDFAKTDPKTGRSVPSKMVLAFISAFTK